jgi:O-antigen ligase
MTDTSNTLSIDTSPTRHRVNRMAVAAVVATLPAWSFSFFDSPRGLPFAAVTAIALLTVTFTMESPSFAVLRLRPAAVWMVIAVAAGTGLALAVNPTIDGALLVVPMAASLGLVLSIAAFTTDELRRYVAVPLLATAAVQAVVIAIQAATGNPTVLRWISPDVGGLFNNGGVVRAQGMYDHSYEAAAVAVVAIALGFALIPKEGSMRTFFLVSMGAAATTVALTQSRSAVLALVLVVGVVVVATVRADLSGWAGVGVVGVAFIVPALLTAGAWTARLDETLTGDLDAATLGRVGLIEQGIEVIGDHPLFGVGPNGYLPALAEQYNEPGRLYGHIHNQPLQIAAELGIPAAIAFSVLLVWAGLQAVRDGYRPLILFAAPLPFVVFDVLLYVKLVGLLLIAAWAGALAVFHVSASRARQ